MHTLHNVEICSKCKSCFAKRGGVGVILDLITTPVVLPSECYNIMPLRKIYSFPSYYVIPCEYKSFSVFAE